MSRDEMAFAIMQTTLARPDMKSIAELEQESTNEVDLFEEVARCSYKMADAMLEERAK